jgi:hypothetical protein
MRDRNREWTDYFTKRLAETEEELAGFESAIAKHGLRIRHRDINGERDVTEEQRQHLKDAIEEYRRMLRDD